MNEGFKPENSPPYSIDNPKIYLTGDIMYDNALFFAGLAEKKKSSFLGRLSIERDGFILITIHRDINTDDTKRLEDIVTTLLQIAEEKRITMVMPFHPRTIISLKNNLAKLYSELLKCEFVRVVPPVSYLEMIMLEKNCRMIITDSGGVQKESHFFKKPCIVLRKETEWTELVKNGTAVLADADPGKLRYEIERFSDDGSGFSFPAFYGDGKTAEFILNEIIMLFDKV